MQGPSEFGVVGDALLKDWDRKDDLKKLKIPVLTIGGEHDTMDPKQIMMIKKSKMVLIFIVQMEAIGACMMIKKIILMVLQVLLMLYLKTKISFLNPIK